MTRSRSLRWLTFGGLAAALLLASARLLFGVTVLRGMQPSIEFYTADRLVVDYPGVEAGLEAVTMSWKAVNVPGDHFMRMEAWVGGRWVLIGEHFAPEKSDRIVVSHPLGFSTPLYRLTILDSSGQIADERRLEIGYSDAETTPRIAQLTAPVRGGIPVDALQNGSVTVPVLWRIEERGYRQQPVIEQVAMPSGAVIAAPLADLEM